MSTDGPTTDEQASAPPGIDVSIPSIARVYDYVLGGKDNFASDRAASQAFLDTMPETPLLARDNRDFLRRAVRWLVAEAGIRQIVDIGSGLPTAGNVHEIAREVADDVRVVYVDVDPIVLVHGRALLEDDAGTTVIQADIRDPEAIFADPALQELVDLSQPVAVLVSSLLHHLADDEHPEHVAAAITSRLVSGSYLLIANFFDPGDDTRAPRVEKAFLEGGLGTGRFRTRAEQEPYFEGLEMVEPGLVFANDWRPDGTSPRESPVHRLYVGGIGRKP
jgi:SAM-dependent methyltransferase